MIEVLSDFGPFEAKTEEKWYSMKTARLVGLLYKMDSEEIEEVVARAPSLLKELEIGNLSADERRSLGEALVLGDSCEHGYSILADVAKEVSSGNEEFGKWIWWQAGWAALLMNDEMKANEAFNIVLTDSSGNTIEQMNWDQSQWFAAWFLGKVTETELIKYCAHEGSSMYDDPYFFIGEKNMMEGKLDRAKKAYGLCIKFGTVSHDTWPGNWTRWRLKQLEARDKSTSEEK